MACILSLARFPAQNRPSKYERVYASSPSPFRININGPSSNYIPKKPRADNRLTMTAFFSIAILPQQVKRMSQLSRNAVSGSNSGVQTAKNAPTLPDFVKLCKDYTYLGGTPFFGTESAIEAQDWLDTCERIFRDLNLTYQPMMVRLASTQFRGRAMRWWDDNKSKPDVQTDWEKFKKLFADQYITAVQKSVLFQRFANLRQGDMSVSEYVAEFIMLSKYGLPLIDDKVRKSQKFVTGLNDPLGEMLLNQVDQSFEDLVVKALRHESLYPKSVLASKEDPKLQVSGRGKKKWNNNKKKRKQLQIMAGQDQKESTSGAGAFVIRKIVDIADKEASSHGAGGNTPSPSLHFLPVLPNP